MADILMYIPNDNTQNYPFCILQLVVKTFGHSTKWTNQSKFNKSLQRCKNQGIRERCYKTFGTNKHPSGPSVAACGKT